MQGKNKMTRGSVQTNTLHDICKLYHELYDQSASLLSSSTTELGSFVQTSHHEEEHNPPDPPPQSYLSFLWQTMMRYLSS